MMLVLVDSQRYLDRTQVTVGKHGQLILGAVDNRRTVVYFAQAWGSAALVHLKRQGSGRMVRVAQVEPN